MSLDSRPLNLSPLPLSRFRAIIFALCVAWMSFIAWWHRNVVIDDPWITFRYARNLLAGEGLVFNIGERLEGYSNLTWVWISAVGIFLRIEPLGFTRLVSWLCGAGLLAMMVFGWRRAGELPPEREVIEGAAASPAEARLIPHRSAAAAALLASAHPFAVWIMGGLETILYTFLVFAFVVALADHWITRSTTSAACVAGTLTLLFLTRPEGFMWIAGGVVVALLMRERRRLAIALAGTAAALLVYTSWRAWYFGTIVPNTVSAKVGGSIFSALLAGFRYVIGALENPLAVVAFIALWGLVRLRRRWKAPDLLMGEEKLLLVCAGAVLLQLAFSVAVGGDWMPGGRFVVPALPPLCLGAALVMRRWPLFVQVVVIQFSLAGGLVAARLDPDLRWCRWWSRDHGGVLLIEPLRETGQWLRSNASPDATFAATEAGVMPYVSALRFYDMLGLVDAEIASLPGGLHQKYDAQTILRRSPDYIVLGLVQTPSGLQGKWAPDQQMLAREDFTQTYREATRIRRVMDALDDRGRRTMAEGWMVVYRRVDGE